MLAPLGSRLHLQGNPFQWQPRLAECLHQLARRPVLLQPGPPVGLPWSVWGQPLADAEAEVWMWSKRACGPRGEQQGRGEDDHQWGLSRPEVRASSVVTSCPRDRLAGYGLQGNPFQPLPAE